MKNLIPQGEDILQDSIPRGGGGRGKSEIGSLGGIDHKNRSSGTKGHASGLGWNLIVLVNSNLY
jgi:hypothetical protein